MAHPDKVARYDRQLRLWGEAGQSFLERAHVLLLGVSVAGCETLKNLVLPGIGAFTVVDGRKVEPTDLGLNFFVTADSIGKPRARVCAELLGELNEYVKSHFVEEDPVTLIAKDPTFVASYTVVLASQLPEETLQSVARVCEARGIALLALRSLGLFGSLRISAPVHKVIESRRENQLEDLRVWAPFPSLAAFAQQFNPQTAHERHHIPYPVLLIHALNHFRASHGGQGPANRKQLDEVKALLKSWAPPGPLTEVLRFVSFCLL
jgi:amyloid beta precursor protein binding protein 1